MIPISGRRHVAPTLLWLLAAMLLLATLRTASAGPGAHGPGGEHLDAPTAAAGAHPGAVSPRLEAASDLFELVARHTGRELSILIDRFATNEPVLGAQVEVESGGLKAKATFHADHGDYAVDDAALLKMLAQPGEHPLVFTVIAGQDSDLLDGILKVETVVAQDGDAAHLHLPLAAGLALGAMALVLIIVGAWRLRARRRARAAGGSR